MAAEVPGKEEKERNTKSMRKSSRRGEKRQRKRNRTRKRKRKRKMKRKRKKKTKRTRTKKDKENKKQKQEEKEKRSKDPGSRRPFDLSKALRYSQVIQMPSGRGTRRRGKQPDSASSHMSQKLSHACLSIRLVTSTGGQIAELRVPFQRPASRARC